MTTDNIKQAMARFPLEDTAHLPTPLESMPRLSDFCGGARLFVKRDDCTGLALGGNKARQISVYLGDAVAKGADTVLITGAVQSNYVRSVAAAAARLGLECHVQLEERVDRDDHAYRHSGNVLLDHLFGATVHSFPVGEDEFAADAMLDTIADGLRDKGRNPYVIHLGPNHPPLGALGYTLAAAELLDQLEAKGIQCDEFVLASGSSHTHAGFLVGLRLANANQRVSGICVRRSGDLQAPRVLANCRGIEALLGCGDVVQADDVNVIDDFFAPGYGKLNDPTIEALTAGARLEGLVLDPVYTAKSMAGCMARARATDPDRTIVYIHTGGAPGVFAYEKDLTAALGLSV